MTKTLAPVSRHYDQVRAQPLRQLQYLDAGIAHHDVNFVAGLAVDLLARELLEPGSRRRLHFSKRQRHLRTRRHCNYVKHV